MMNNGFSFRIFFDHKQISGHIYTRYEVEKTVTDVTFQELINTKGLFVYGKDPSSPTLFNIPVGVVTSYRITDKYIEFHGMAIDNFNGSYFKNLIQTRRAVIKPEGSCQRIDEDGTLHDIVITEFKLEKGKLEE